MNKDDFRAFGLVFIFGGLAAILSYANASYRGTETFEIPGLILAIGLGALASVIFLFLIVNTDRTDLLRLVAFASLTGFFYDPVLEIARNYLDEVSQERAVASAQQAAARTEEVIAQAAASGGTMSDEQRLALEDALADFAAESGRVNDPRFQMALSFSRERLIAELDAVEEIDGANIYVDQLRALTPFGGQGSFFAGGTVVPPDNRRFQLPNEMVDG